MSAITKSEQIVTNQGEYNLNIETTLKKILWGALAPVDSLITVLVTQPLADALALKTYTHGTNFSSYLNIRCFGGDPSKGGAPSGATCKTQPQFLVNCKGYFHMFKDISDFDDISLYSCTLNEQNSKIEHKVRFIEGEIIKTSAGETLGKNGIIIIDNLRISIPQYIQTPYRILPITPLGSSNEFNGNKDITINGQLLDLSRTIIKRTIKTDRSKYICRLFFPLGFSALSSLPPGRPPEFHEKGFFKALACAIAGGLLSPTISIRMADGDPLQSQLEIDNDFKRHAYKISKPIPTSYIGLRGIISQGMSNNLLSRVKSAPIKVCIGVARLVALTTAIWSLYNTEQYR